MRSFNGGGVCTYGVNSQAGYLFERSQNALRQRSFGRARGLMNPMKRRRDSDSDSEREERRPDSRVLDGIKRMRVSSPPPSLSPMTEGDAAMTDEQAATPRSTWRADQSLVPVTTAETQRRPLILTPAEPWKAVQEQVSMATELQIPTDESCRAMVVFDPYRSMKLSSEPTVELVESDDEKTSESSHEFVRFEELSSDNDEPVDMDVD